MRNKLIELIEEAKAGYLKTAFLLNLEQLCDMPTSEEYLADHLLANGVTLQTAPISYERLLHIARQMHLWIFLNVADEQATYDALKLTEEENVVFGYGGKLEITMPEPPKENE